MVSRLTSGWTELHLPLAVNGLLAVGIGWAAYAHSLQYSAALIALAFACLMLSSLLDAFAGLAVGVAGATCFVVLDAVLGTGVPGDQAPWGFLATTLLLILLCTNTGLIADTVRRSGRRRDRSAERAVVAAEGTLGMLDREDAEFRLHEEVCRARQHQRPLCSAVVKVDVHDADLSPEAARRASRAVARTLESQLRSTDIPFVLSDGEFGVILPESDRERAEDVLESVLILGREVTFADRAGGSRRHVGAVADLKLAVRHLDLGEGTDARIEIDRTRGQLVGAPQQAA